MPEPTELPCGCCGKSVALTGEERVSHKDILCPHCGERNEVHADAGLPPWFRLHYRLECKGK